MTNREAADPAAAGDAPPTRTSPADEEHIRRLASLSSGLSPLIRVRSSVFTMGTNRPEILLDGEHPARRVLVGGFAMERYEVSVAQFAAFVSETGYRTEADVFGWSFAFANSLSKATLETVKQQVEEIPWWVPVTGANWLHPFGPDSVAEANHPVTHVSHNDAVAYCEHYGRRLPREAEFERAIKGTTHENATFPWGEEVVPAGVHRANLWQGVFPTTNTGEDGHLWTAPVDSYEPQNDFGFYNIIGNVWEWVADAWVVDHARYLTPEHRGRFEGAEYDLADPQVEVSASKKRDTERVKRGGSYMCHKSYCYRYRSAARSHNSADSSAQNLGFRCASD